MERLNVLVAFVFLLFLHWIFPAGMKKAMKAFVQGVSGILRRSRRQTNAVQQMHAQRLAEGHPPLENPELH